MQVSSWEFLDYFRIFQEIVASWSPQLQDILFVHRCLVALIKRFLLSSPMHCNEISHRGSSKPLVIVSCPKLYHQHAGNAGRSVRPRCTFLNGCLTNTGTSRQPAIVSRNTWMLHFRCHAPPSLFTSPSCCSASDAIQYWVEGLNKN